MRLHHAGVDDGDADASAVNAAVAGLAAARAHVAGQRAGDAGHCPVVGRTGLAARLVAADCTRLLQSGYRPRLDRLCLTPFLGTDHWRSAANPARRFHPSRMAGVWRNHGPARRARHGSDRGGPAARKAERERETLIRDHCQSDSGLWIDAQIASTHRANGP